MLGLGAPRLRLVLIFAEVEGVCDFSVDEAFAAAASLRACAVPFLVLYRVVVVVGVIALLSSSFAGAGGALFVFVFEGEMVGVGAEVVGVALFARLEGDDASAELSVGLQALGTAFAATENHIFCLFPCWDSSARQHPDLVEGFGRSAVGIFGKGQETGSVICGTVVNYVVGMSPRRSLPVCEASCLWFFLLWHCAGLVLSRLCWLPFGW